MFYICIFMNVVIINVVNFSDITFNFQNNDLDITLDVLPTELIDQGILKIINSK